MYLPNRLDRPPLRFLPNCGGMILFGIYSVMVASQLVIEGLEQNIIVSERIFEKEGPGVLSGFAGPCWVGGLQDMSAKPQSWSNQHPGEWPAHIWQSRACLLALICNSHKRIAPAEAMGAGSGLGSNQAPVQTLNKKACYHPKQRTWLSAGCKLADVAMDCADGAGRGWVIDQCCDTMQTTWNSQHHPVSHALPVC